MSKDIVMNKIKALQKVLCTIRISEVNQKKKIKHYTMTPLLPLLLHVLLIDIMLEIVKDDHAHAKESYTCVRWNPNLHTYIGIYMSYEPGVSLKCC